MSAAPTVRILGIDPGLRFTGFGVLEKTGSRLQYIASGCVSTQRKDGSEALAPRLKTILDGVREVIATYAPQQVAMEKVHTQVEETAQAEQKQNLERRAPPPHRAQRMRPWQKQPQLRFQRSLAAPSNVMVHPTRAKMQEQEGHKM
jgi:hypothetical protein